MSIHAPKNIPNDMFGEITLDYFDNIEMSCKEIETALCSQTWRRNALNPLIAVALLHHYDPAHL